MTTDPLTPDAFDALLRAADPRARCVPPRILRRILKQESKLGVLGLHLAHRRSLTVATREAVRCVGAEELGLDPQGPTPETLLLIEAIDTDDQPRDVVLVTAWRRLFHAAVHAEVAARRAAGTLDDAAIRARIDRLGRLAFAEAGAVLERDDWLMTPSDEPSVYEEFVAVYLELRWFAPTLLPATFPGLDDPEAVDRLLAQDVDAEALFRSTRPEGAPDPAQALPPPEPEVPDRDLPTGEAIAPRSEPRFKWFLARAAVARKAGNVVRSAALSGRAARLAGPARAGQARAAAEDDLDGLAERLVAALGLDPEDRPRWRPALSALLARSDRAIWPVELRLLYDLQKVCIDHEREVYDLDLLGWAVSLGRRPLKRPLPNQRLVRTAKHLRSASRRLRKIRIGDRLRNELTAMIHDATENAEEAVRERFRPLIERALDRAEVRPANLPERASREKMTDELLDRVVHAGFLTMGDVRDALARGSVKQPDVAGPRDWLRGDRVLLANRRLAVSLDGVYHRGEVYLRALQRASFLAFGTRAGRWLTRYLALPYGAAFGALVTIQELVGLAGLHHEFVHWATVLPLGTVILVALHREDFRAVVLEAASGLGRGLRVAFYDLPAWILDRPLIRRILLSSTFDLTRRVLLQPLAFGAMAFGLVLAMDRDPAAAAVIALAVFAALVVFSSSPAGRRVEEYVADSAVRAWGRIRSDFVPGLIRYVMDVFDRFLEGVERVLYTVDEKLRFRSGQGKFTLGVKAVLTLIWAGVTYLIRIYINLLVEPQINPVKHFPTVTVAAKMLIPSLKPLTMSLAGALWFLGRVPSYGVAAITVFFLPGLAGFVVWELKENWRLFEANRAPTLRPVMVGHHGETMRRMVRPGFHSGTIPKLFAKLRRAEAKALRDGDHRAVRKALAGLHEARDAVAHFVDRDFVELVRLGGRLGDRQVGVGGVDLTTNRATVAITEASAPGRPLRASFEDHGDRFLARVADGGWRSDLGPVERGALDVALQGLFALAGADAIDLDGDLAVDLGPHALSGPVVPEDPSLAAATVSWPAWVAYWEAPPLPATRVEADRERPAEVANL